MCCVLSPTSTLACYLVAVQLHPQPADVFLTSSPFLTPWGLLDTLQDGVATRDARLLASERSSRGSPGSSLGPVLSVFDQLTCRGLRVY